MLVTAILFVPVARFYKGDTYLHEELSEPMPGRE